jgi:hypothetical protein
LSVHLMRKAAAELVGAVTKLLTGTGRSAHRLIPWWGRRDSTP